MVFGDHLILNTLNSVGVYDYLILALKWPNDNHLIVNTLNKVDLIRIL